MIIAALGAVMLAVAVAALIIGPLLDNRWFGEAHRLANEAENIDDPVEALHQMNEARKRSLYGASRAVRVCAILLTAFVGALVVGAISVQEILDRHAKERDERIIEDCRTTNEQRLGNREDRRQDVRVARRALSRLQNASQREFDPGLLPSFGDLDPPERQVILEIISVSTAGALAQREVNIASASDALDEAERAESEYAQRAPIVDCDGDGRVENGEAGDPGDFLLPTSDD